MQKVVIVQRRLVHYRVPLFELLRARLRQENVQLRVYYGQGTDEEKKKNDEGILPWGVKLPTRYFLGGRLCWQPIARIVRYERPALVIVTQENKLLQNYLLLLIPRSFKLAFWGHGANFQASNANSFSERFKRWISTKVDWWFGYSIRSMSLISATGFSVDRISVLQNAVDLTDMKKHALSIDETELAQLRSSLGITGTQCGVFIGSLYSEKRIEFLLNAASLIRRRLPGFVLLIVGDGPDREMVAARLGEKCDEIRWVGPKFGREKVLYSKVGKIMLSPGAVGLAVLDAFVCRTPLITTKDARHGPEIDYLEDGRNGLIVEGDLNCYVDACVSVLCNEELLEELRQGCDSAANLYTLENMVKKFSEGIQMCLNDSD